VDQGVDVLFGYPGGARCWPIYDALFAEPRLKACAGASRAGRDPCCGGPMRAPTGKCGVVLVTSGPGATNAVTGIVDAPDG